MAEVAAVKAGVARHIFNLNSDNNPSGIAGGINFLELIHWLGGEEAEEGGFCNYGEVPSGGFLGFATTGVVAGDEGGGRVGDGGGNFGAERAKLCGGLFSIHAGQGTGQDIGLTGEAACG